MSCLQGQNKTKKKGKVKTDENILGDVNRKYDVAWKQIQISTAHINI